MTDVSTLSVKQKMALFNKEASTTTSTPVKHTPVATKSSSVTIHLAQKFEAGKLNNASDNRTNDTSADEAIATNFAKNLYLSGHGNPQPQQRRSEDEAASLALIAQMQADEQAQLEMLAKRQADEKASEEFIAQLLAAEERSAPRPA